MLDEREYFLCICRTQINPVAGSQVIDVEVTVACSGLRRDPHEMSQHVWDLVARWMQAGNFDLLFTCFAEPDKCMTVAGRGTGAKVHVIGTLGRNARSILSDRFHFCRRWGGAWC